MYPSYPVPATSYPETKRTPGPFCLLHKKQTTGNQRALNDGISSDDTSFTTPTTPVRNLTPPSRDKSCTGDYAMGLGSGLLSSHTVHPKSSGGKSLGSYPYVRSTLSTQRQAYPPASPRALNDGISSETSFISSTTPGRNPTTPVHAKNHLTR